MAQSNEKKNLVVFGVGLAVIAFIFGVGGWVKHGLSGFQATELAAGLVLLSAAVFQWQSLRLAYKLWMAVAKVVGDMVLVILLSLVYWVLFTPFGLGCKLFGRDHLERRFSRTANSYWRKCSESPEGRKQNYIKQF